MDYILLANEEEKKFKEFSSSLSKALQRIPDEEKTFGDVIYVYLMLAKLFVIDMMSYLIRRFILWIIELAIKPFHKEVSEQEFAESSYELYAAGTSLFKKIYFRFEERIPSFEQKALMRFIEA